MHHQYRMAMAERINGLKGGPTSKRELIYSISHNPLAFRCCTTGRFHNVIELLKIADDIVTKIHLREVRTQHEEVQVHVIESGAHESIPQIDMLSGIDSIEVIVQGYDLAVVHANPVCDWMLCIHRLKHTMFKNRIKCEQ